LINPPDAARAIFGSCDTGDNVKTATVDIIDNSIAAGATEVNIDIQLMADGRKIVCFGDNGEGMDADGVWAAMRYGSSQRTSAKSLGKFGLGLKTASSSVCLRFSLISRKSADQPLAKLTWDLEHVADRNDWEMQNAPVTTDEKDSFEDLCGYTGTIPRHWCG
jgi:hypothetical protein